MANGVVAGWSGINRTWLWLAATISMWLAAKLAAGWKWRQWQCVSQWRSWETAALANGLCVLLANLILLPKLAVLSALNVSMTVWYSPKLTIRWCVALVFCHSTLLTQWRRLPTVPLLFWPMLFDLLTIVMTDDWYWWWYLRLLWLIFVAGWPHSFGITFNQWSVWRSMKLNDESLA